MDARQAIYDWSQTQPLWRRDLLRRVAIRDATNQDCAEVLELLLKENGLAPAAPVPVALQLTDLPEETPSVTEVLLQIGECSDVNAIDSKEPLTFEPGHITLIYGENSTGKTGYSRIIKRVARAAHEERVLPNVFSAGSSRPPKAVIEIEDQRGRRKNIVPLDQARPVLGSITVFDSRCATVYLRDAKTVEFTPAPLQLFGRAASAQQTIRGILDERIAAMRSQEPNLEGFAAGTQVRNALDQLSSAVSDQQLRDLANLSDDEVTEFGKLKLELASTETGTALTQARQRERDGDAIATYSTQLETIRSALSNEQVNQLSKARRRALEAEEAVSIARSAAFATEPLPSTGSGGWRAMWEAARTFVEKDCEHDFPLNKDGDLCPLCQQKLSLDARKRFEQFEAFVKGTVEQELSLARSALKENEDSIPLEAIDTAMESPTFKLLEDEESELAASVREWLTKAKQRATALAEEQKKKAPVLGTYPRTKLDHLATKLKEDAQRQKQSIDPRRQEDVRQAVAELEARSKLKERLAEILTWRSTAITIAALVTARGQLDTTSLSHKQSELAKTLVTKELCKAVRRELDSLGFAHLKVDLDCRTQRGETLARMSLDGAAVPVSDVLSDGEQRGCALAFFLAEALVSPSEGGIVFDDPACSLDIERVEHIGVRLVELAKKRKQIIVFTHDLPFAWFLRDTAEKAGVGFSARALSRLEGKAGIVRKGKPWPGDKLATRLGYLREMLSKLKTYSQQGDIDAYEPMAKAFASELRVTWECAVEEGLFKKVVMRFQRDVHASHIQDVIVTPALTKEVFEGMTETNPYHHSSPLAKPTPTPSFEDLHRFFTRLEQFSETVKQKRGTAHGDAISKGTGQSVA